MSYSVGHFTTAQVLIAMRVTAVASSAAQSIEASQISTPDCFAVAAFATARPAIVAAFVAGSALDHLQLAEELSSKIDRLPKRH